MNKPVQDRVGQGRVPDAAVPLRERDLGRYQRRFEIVAALKDFEEILTVLGGHGRQKEVLDQEKILPGQILQECWKFSGLACNVESLEEAGESDEKDAIAQSAGIVSQGFSQIAFSDSCGTCDEDVLVFGDPLSGEKRLSQRLGKVPGNSEVEILGDGVLPKASRLEPSLRLKIGFFAKSLISDWSPLLKHMKNKLLRYGVSP